jgi:O-antigen/teichoic acid export membrane protein
MRSVSFFKGLSWLFLLNLLVKPVWIFLIDRQVQNLVGHEAYGNYFAVLGLSYVLLFIADAGLSTAMSQKAAGGQPIHTIQYVRLKSVLSLFYLLIVCLTGWITGLEQWTLVLYVAGIQLLGSFFVFLRSLITANQFFTTDALLSVLDKFLVILFCAGLIYYPASFGSINLFLFLKIQLACTGIATLSALFFALKKQLFVKGAKEDLASIIKTITPFALVILLMSMHCRMDGFLLERMHANGAYQAGLYASAYRLPDALNMVGYLAASFLLPFIARHQTDKKLTGEVIAKTRNILLFFGTGVACFTILFAPWIQQLLYHTGDVYNSKLIRLCIAALPAYLLTHIYGSALTATAKFRALLLILLASVILNLLLNLILIPPYGAWGCGMAALTSQYFCALSCYIVAGKSLQLPFMARSGMVYAAMAAGLSWLFWLCRLTMLNVWFILVLTICIMLVFLVTRFGLVKKYFIRTR